MNVDLKIGYICPTIQELKEKIELLIDNKSLRNELGNKSYNYAFNNHASNDYFKIITNLMGL